MTTEPKAILVTGAKGFIGRHLVDSLSRRQGLRVHACDVETPGQELLRLAAACDVIFHLAGVNRPQNESEFKIGNADLTAELCKAARAGKRNPTVVLSSSIQATVGNPYGVSKRLAEAEVERLATEDGGSAVVFRLPNVFGKWCRPNYNSVVATFCHNIAHDLPITVSDPARELCLVHVGDVATAMVSVLDKPPEPGSCEQREVVPTYRVTLGGLADALQGFKDSRRTLRLPDFGDTFTKLLYGTYLSYLEPQSAQYPLERRTDARGVLAEFVKSKGAGQIFVSRTKPGITRGNHWHHSKTEKFLVVEGEAVIRFRHVNGNGVTEFRVSGKDFNVVDILPGYTHSIENVGETEMVVVFWACEVFDPANPDTMFTDVLVKQEGEGR